MKPTQKQVSDRAADLRNEATAESIPTDVVETYAGHDFSVLSINELGEILSLTIKEDDVAKKLLFLACVVNYVGDNQLNIALNGPSSSGKTYISKELLKLFPGEDVITIGKVSPQAFYHAHGKMSDNEEDRTILVDLEKKIYFFTDQPNSELLANLRPLLSKDNKEVKAMITDRNKRGGNRTKTVILRGFPTIIFCSANLNMDEQERTRLLLLSPDLSQRKIDAAVAEALKRASDKTSQVEAVEIDERVKELKKRVIAIKYSGISEVVIDHQSFKAAFQERYARPLPRHSRDIERISYLIKGSCLLNFQHRKRRGTELIANQEDIDTVFGLWDKISVSQDAGIQPYVADFFKEYIQGAYQEKYSTLENVEEVFGVSAADEKVRGVTFKEICRYYYKKQRQPLNTKYLRQQILEGLDQADWISIVKNPENAREFLVVIEKTEEKTDDQQ